jgi:hypothetical protein
MRLDFEHRGSSTDEIVLSKFPPPAAVPHRRRARFQCRRFGAPGHRHCRQCRGAEAGPALRIFSIRGGSNQYRRPRYTVMRSGSPILDRLKLSREGYFLVTLHRAENVDLPDRRTSFSVALQAVARTYDSRSLSAPTRAPDRGCRPMPRPGLAACISWSPSLLLRPPARRHALRGGDRLAAPSWPR